MRTMLGLAFAIIGLGLVVAGAWLNWDVMNTMMHMWRLGYKHSDFKFPLPFFVYTYENWTAVFDLAFTLQLVGYGLTLAGGILLEPAVRKLIRKT